jgi:hypothetical protein
MRLLETVRSGEIWPPPPPPPPPPPRGETDAVEAAAERGGDVRTGVRRPLLVAERSGPRRRRAGSSWPRPPRGCAGVAAAAAAPCSIGSGGGGGGGGSSCRCGSGLSTAGTLPGGGPASIGPCGRDSTRLDCDGDGSNFSAPVSYAPPPLPPPGGLRVIAAASLDLVALSIAASMAANARQSWRSSALAAFATDGHTPGERAGGEGGGSDAAPVLAGTWLLPSLSPWLPPPPPASSSSSSSSANSRRSASSCVRSALLPPRPAPADDRDSPAELARPVRADAPASATSSPSPSLSTGGGCLLSTARARWLDPVEALWCCAGLLSGERR